MTSGDEQILVLSPSTGTARRVSNSLQAGGLDVFMTRYPSEAVRHLGDITCRLFIVDARLQDPPALALLTKLRQVAPQMPCALLKTEDTREEQLEGLEQSEAWPFAVFTDSLSAAEVQKYLDTLRAQADQLNIGVQAGLGAQAAGDLELDYSSDDMVAELARVVMLLSDRPDWSFPLMGWSRLALETAVRPHGEIEQMVQAVAGDVGLSIALLAEAGADAGGSLRNAVARLGPERTQELVRGRLEKDDFEPELAPLKKAAPVLWVHSQACGTGTELLCRRLLPAEAEKGYAGGLLHDTGKWIIVEALEKGYQLALWTERLVTEDLLDQLFTRYHNELGARYLGDRIDDPTLAEVARLHNDDQRVQGYSEHVVMTYFANQLTRLSGASLVSYDSGQDPLKRSDICRALNIDDSIREGLAERLRSEVEALRARTPA